MRQALHRDFLRWSRRYLDMAAHEPGLSFLRRLTLRVLVLHVAALVVSTGALIGSARAAFGPIAGYAVAVVLGVMHVNALRLQWWSGRRAVTPRQATAVIFGASMLATHAVLEPLARLSAAAASRLPYVDILIPDWTAMMKFIVGLTFAVFAFAWAAKPNAEDYGDIALGGVLAAFCAIAIQGGAQLVDDGRFHLATIPAVVVAFLALRTTWSQVTGSASLRTRIKEGLFSLSFIGAIVLAWWVVTRPASMGGFTAKNVIDRLDRLDIVKAAFVIFDVVGQFGAIVLMLFMIVIVVMSSLMKMAAIIDGARLPDSSNEPLALTSVVKALEILQDTETTSVFRARAARRLGTVEPATRALIIGLIHLRSTATLKFNGPVDVLERTVAQLQDRLRRQLVVSRGVALEREFDALEVVLVGLKSDVREVVARAWIRAVALNDESPLLTSDRYPVCHRIIVPLLSAKEERP